jgi:hypothetical protein
VDKSLFNSYTPQLCLCINTLASPAAMNGSVPGLLAYKQTSTNEPLNPIAFSAIDHGLAHQSSSYPNGHYAPSTMYTHSPMPPLPHHTATNGTAYRLNPAGQYGGNHDSQRIDHLPSPRAFASGAVHSSGAYQEHHAHSSQTDEDGFSEPPVWSNSAGRMDAPLAYSAYPFPTASRSNGRTCEYSISWS